MNTRRDFLKQTSNGFGYLALAALAQQECTACCGYRWLARCHRRIPHFAGKAKRVIFLCMQGGPSHVDTFDYKPKLRKDGGKGAPDAAGRYGRADLMPSPWKFKQHGRSGLVDQRAVPECGEACGRPVHYQLHGHRRARPSASVHADAHGHHAVRAALAGIVDGVWPRQHE